MNILLFVTTLIMVMGVLTYAKIQTFISFAAIQTEFSHYITKVERSAINEQAIWVYENTAASASKVKQPPTNPSSGLSRISLLIFVDEKTHQTKQNELPEKTLLLKRLLDILYHDQKFYTEAIKKNQYIVDTFLERLYLVSLSLPKEKKITKASDLANLDLGDPELNLFLYKILNGTISKEDSPGTPTPSQTPIATLVEDRGEDDDQEKEDPTEEEYKTPTGYRSLLDFLTMKEGSKIRIYLAPKELLIALFGDPGAVDAIIKTRNHLYKAITTGGASAMKPEDASKEFESLYQSRALPEYEKKNLDFKVTKTNPRNYE